MTVKREKREKIMNENYAVNHCYCYSLLDSVLGLFTTTRLELEIKKRYLLGPDQEKNTRPMEKELAQSDLCSKRKVPNTTQKYHICGKWYFQMVFETFLLLGRLD